MVRTTANDGKELGLLQALPTRMAGFFVALHWMMRLKKALIATANGTEIGSHDIGNMDVVAGLQSIAVDHGCFTSEKTAQKDRHDTRFSMRILTLAIDVGVTQTGHIETVLNMEIEEVALSGQLRYAVGRDRACGMILGRRESILLAVDRTASGCKNDLADFGRHCGLEEIEGAEDVHRGVEEHQHGCTDPFTLDEPDGDGAEVQFEEA